MRRRIRDVRKGAESHWLKRSPAPWRKVTAGDEAKAKPRTLRMAQMAESRERQRVDWKLERGKDCRRLEREGERGRKGEGIFSSFLKELFEQ